MQFAPQPRRWVGALVVTAAASLTLGLAGTASAQSAVARAAGPEPLPQAGWHGRPIRHPDLRIPKVARVVERGTSAASVREIQRMLLRVGYTPGPVDGVFGARTRSSVQWFQIKHGFRPTGVVDLPTLDYLRSRSTGAVAQPSGARRDALVARPAEPVSSSPAVARPAQDAAPRHGGMGLALSLLLAALLVTALRLVTVAARRYPRLAVPRPCETPPAVEPVAPSAPAPPRVAAPDPAVETPRAIGYALGRDREEMERNAAAIQHACSERGWSLSCLIRDGGAAPRRSGLAFALKRMSEESAPRLVVGRLSDLGQSIGEVAAVLAWCARLGVALVALDVGLDTRTEHGRLAARCLLALGKRDRRSHAPRSPRRSHGRKLSARARNGA